MVGQPAPIRYIIPADGQLSIIVDPGAWTNLAGAAWTRKAAQKALEAGHKPSQERMQQPLNVQGVGNGHQTATWSTKMPIAVPTSDSSARLHTFESPTVGGSALLGLRGIGELWSIGD